MCYFSDALWDLWDYLQLLTHWSYMHLIHINPHRHDLVSVLESRQAIFQGRPDNLEESSHYLGINHWMGGNYGTACTYTPWKMLSCQWSSAIKNDHLQQGGANEGQQDRHAWNVRMDSLMACCKIAASYQIGDKIHTLRVFKCVWIHFKTLGVCILSPIR